MAAKIINLNRKHIGRVSVHRLVKDHSEWLINWLKAKGLEVEVQSVWEAWPPLQTASLKLARLFGENLKGQDGSSIVGSVVMRATLAFRSKKESGAPIDRAARIYFEQLLDCGELIVTNRIEACAPDGSGDAKVWDPSVDRYDTWCAMQPDNYVIIAHRIEADEGEYAAGRSMVAALIMSPAEYSRIIYWPTEANRKQQ